MVVVATEAVHQYPELPWHYSLRGLCPSRRKDQDAVPGNALLPM